MCFYDNKLSKNGWIGRYQIIVISVKGAIVFFYRLRPEFEQHFSVSFHIHPTHEEPGKKLGFVSNVHPGNT